MKYDMAAISESEVENMRTALATYMETIKEPLGKLTNVVDYGQAFKGDYQVAGATYYVGKMIEEIQKMVDFLTRFDEGLALVFANYQAKARVEGTRISDSSDNIEVANAQTESGVNPFAG